MIIKIGIAFLVVILIIFLAKKIFTTPAANGKKVKSARNELEKADQSLNSAKESFSTAEKLASKEQKLVKQRLKDSEDLKTEIDGKKKTFTK